MENPVLSTLRWMSFVKQKTLSIASPKHEYLKQMALVEQVNGIIKSNNIFKEKDTCKQQMENNLLKFLVYYILYRGQGSLKTRTRDENSF